MPDDPADRPPCACISCSLFIAGGVAVVRADAVVRLIESIADGLHQVECLSCEWRRLHVEAMAVEAVAEALTLTHTTPTQRSTP